MKKKKLSAKLSLGKNRISNLQSTGVKGGNDVTQVSPCPGISEPGPCYSKDCIIGPDSIVPTCAQGCTVPTVPISYCNNGVPNPCGSVQICA